MGCMPWEGDGLMDGVIEMKGMGDELGYQKLQLRRFGNEGGSGGRDGGWWKRFGVRTVKQTGAVSALSFSPVFPHHLAATSGTRVVQYDHHTLHTMHSFSKFKDLAHSGTFRGDGKLLVAGTEDGAVQVFNVSDRSMLRKFEGHKRPVHVTRFSASGTQVLSGSDDTTVRLWDLSESKQIGRLDGHRDYVRCAMQSPTAMDVWATGGYDHVCRVWDVRQGTTSLELDHGAPIESVTFLPSGTLVVTAGGPFLCIWDVLGSGRILRKLESHHKTITAVDVLCTDGTQLDGPRLVSASLDQHVKLYDLNEFRVVHDSRYKNPILSFASTLDGRSYAVGMSNGTVVLRDSKHKETSIPEPSISPALPNSIEEKKLRLSGYDNLLRKFRYKDALDLVLKEKDVCSVSAVVEELAARDGLVAALSGRSADDLVSLLTYIDTHIGNPHFTDLVTPLLEILLDLYDTDVPLMFCASLTDPTLCFVQLAAKPLDKKLVCILRSLQRELSLLIEMKELEGSIQAVLGSRWH